MEGIILEELEDKLIVLIKGGEFIEIDKPNYPVEIGQKIIVNTQRKKSKYHLKHFISAAAVFMILLTGGYGVYGYYTPYGYINVDINPSLEVAYNLYGKSIKLRGLNQDGNQMLKKMDNFKSKSIERVIDKIIETAVQEKFITKEKENKILITVTELNRKIDNEKLEKEVQRFIQQRKVKAAAVVIKGNKAAYQQAKKQGISPSKIILKNQIKPKIKQKIEYQIKPDKKEKQQIHIQPKKQPKQKLKDNKKEQGRFKEKTKKIQKRNQKEKQSKKEKNHKKEKKK